MKEAELIVKPFYDLTKEDLHSMIRNPNRLRLSIQRMINFYEVTLDEYIEHIKDMGFKLTRNERHQIYEMENKDKVLVQDGLTFDVPDYILCALYDIDFEVVGKTVYYDQDQLLKAREKAKEKMIGYHERKMSATENEDDGMTKLKPIDLVAMRIYRGVNRKKFASKILKPIGYVKELEQTSPVSKSTAKLYMDTLKIKKRHIMQLRKVMTGKLDKITDDRTIPKVIKLKVWKRDKAKCSNCGAKDQLHYHHIEHYADGGQNTVENLTLLCVDCHAEEHKGDKSYYMLKAQSEG